MEFRLWCVARQGGASIVDDGVRDARGASQVLAWGRELMDAPVRAAVDGLAEPMRTVVGYHLGWCDEHGLPAAGAAGKMLRPALALLCAEAVGGVAQDAVPAGVAVELVHNFSLVHDDVMDGDRVRHHRSTVWAVFGIPAAVLAGDALLALALRVVASSDGPGVGEGTRMVSETVARLIDGQGADLDFESRKEVTVAECLGMAAGKTGALLGCACALGALFGGGAPGQVELLRGFGEQAGLAFQLVDDLLGIWGDPQVTGKPVGADLARRKKSLPVVAALASGTRAGRDLAQLYVTEQPLTSTDLARAAQLVEQAGGRAWAQREADRRLAGAIALLGRVDPTSRAAAELATVASALAHRDH